MKKRVMKYQVDLAKMIISELPMTLKERINALCKLYKHYTDDDILQIIGVDSIAAGFVMFDYEKEKSQSQSGATDETDKTFNMF